MASYLLDTNVISELVRPAPHPRVVAFLQSSPDLWLSAITLHELSYGAERAKPPRRKAQLVAWIEGIRQQFGDRVIPVDDDGAMASGRLRALAITGGRADDPLDAIIAAAAASRGLTLATRNIKDFEGFGIALHDPWSAPVAP